MDSTDNISPLSLPSPALRPSPGQAQTMSSDDEAIELEKYKAQHRENARQHLEGEIRRVKSPFERPRNSTPNSRRPDVRSSGDLPPRPDRNSVVSTSSRASNRFSMTPSYIPLSALGATPESAEALIGLRSHESLPGNTTLPSRRVSSIPEALPNYPSPAAAAPDPGEPKNSSMSWLQTGMAVLIVFNCWGVSNAFGLFQAYYELYYIPGTPPGIISWIGSTQLALVFGLGVPVGQLVDKGYFRHAFHGGTVLMIVGLFCSGWCQTFGTLWLVQGLLTGIGMGCVFTAGLVALMSWFDERKMGMAMGLPAAGSCVGGIIYVLISRTCLANLGFPSTMRVMAGVSLATMIPPTFLFRERRRPALQARPPRQPRGSRRRIFFQLFADPAYLFAAAGMFLSFEGLYFGFIYLVSYASQILQLSDTAATNLLIYMLLANIPGRLVPALISDRLSGPINTMIPATVLSSIVMWAWLGSPDSTSSLTAIACLYGFVSGGIQALYAPSIYSFCLEPVRGDPQGAQAVIDRIGVKAGGIFTCIGVAVLIGTPIGGALISYRIDRVLDGPYLGAQVFAGITLLLGGLFLTASRVKKVGFSFQRA